MPERPLTPDEKLQQEFNRWATAGEGPKMENHHLDITAKTIRRMNLRPGERVLDLGCGSGWATRLLARLVGEGPDGFGQVVGLDVEDESKERLDCYDAAIPPKPKPKSAPANGVMDCRYVKEEDERLKCFNGFAEKIPKFSSR